MNMNMKIDINNNQSRLTDWATNYWHRSDDNSNNSIKLIHIESLARVKEEGDVERNVWKNDVIEPLRICVW